MSDRGKPSLVAILACAGNVLNNLDPFNPLDKQNLAASVAEALLGRKALPLGELESFHGAGIYAIYYTGDFPPYALLGKRNSGDKFNAPIYVGKAVPQGARKGGVGTSTTRTKALFNRLGEHAESILLAGNLDLKDFSCRFLIVDDIWIPLGESLLIAKFSPIWNTIIDGFGNHDPGKGRYQGMRPRWDVLHHGRSWADKCKPRPETVQEIVADVAQFLRATPEPRSPHFYVEQLRANYQID